MTARRILYKAMVCLTTLGLATGTYVPQASAFDTNPEGDWVYGLNIVADLDFNGVSVMGFFNPPAEQRVAGEIDDLSRRTTVNYSGLVPQVPLLTFGETGGSPGIIYNQNGVSFSDYVANASGDTSGSGDMTTTYIIGGIVLLGAGAALIWNNSDTSD